MLFKRTHHLQRGLIIGKEAIVTETTQVKVLGMAWNTVADAFFVQLGRINRVCEIASCYEEITVEMVFQDLRSVRILISVYDKA